MLGNNMFAYCLNFPVCSIDPDGMCPHDYRFYTDGPFKGQFEYNPSCVLCAAHGEFWLIAPNGEAVNLAISQDQKVLIATIAAEATVTAKGKPVSQEGRQAMANVALNRVGTREWSKYTSVADVCRYSGFDGYGNKYYHACMEYLNNRDGCNRAYEAIVWAVLQAYEHDITNGCQMYYTPAAMSPSGKQPGWVNSKIEEVIIPGVDSYYEGRFFKYKGGS